MEDIDGNIREMFYEIFGKEGERRDFSGEDVRDIALIVVSELVRRLLERPRERGVRFSAVGSNHLAPIQVIGLEGAVIGDLLDMQQSLVASKYATNQAIFEGGSEEEAVR